MTQDEIKTELESYAADPDDHQSFYSPAATDWPDNRLPFVEYHLNHLASHKLTNPRSYLSNLKLMIVRR